MWLLEGMQTGEPVSFTAVESESQPVTRVEGIKPQCRLSLIRRARIGGVLTLASFKEDAFTDANISPAPSCTLESKIKDLGINKYGFRAEECEVRQMRMGG